MNDPQSTKQTNAQGALHLTADTFDQTLKDAGDKPVLVDFFATWCGPCQLAAPVIEKMAKEYEGKAVIAKVDVDQQNSLAGRYGVRSIPTVLLFHKGEKVAEKIGFAGEPGYVSMLKTVLKD